MAGQLVSYRQEPESDDSAVGMQTTGTYPLRAYNSATSPLVSGPLFELNQFWLGAGRLGRKEVIFSISMSDNSSTMHFVSILVWVPARINLR